MLFAILALALAAPAAIAEVSLPSVLSDHMVLQRDQEVRIWGKAAAGENVTVSFAGQQVSAQADADGNWSIRLSALPASSDGRTLTITGSNTIELTDVLVGEVWVASGQSNMEFAVAGSANAQQEIADSGNDQIRMWTAERAVSSEPAFDVPGSWQVASPQTTGGFSAVAYFFARQLQEELDVPVGVMHSSWGGTPVEAWTSRPVLDSIEWAQPILHRYRDALETYDQRIQEYNDAMSQWEQFRDGPANTGFAAGYANADFDDSQWQTMALPQRWENAGLNKDGVVWFRRTVELPDGWAGQALTLSLGPIDDGDTTYINGTRVGELAASTRGGWQVPRTYNIPAELVGEGALTLAVRVVDLSGEGGIWGRPEQLSLARADGQGDALSLVGEWRYLLSQEINASNRAVQPRGLPFGPDHPHAPAGLFNGMINPILPYTIRGAIWYQGESNASRAQQYRQLFPAMIQDWRARWGQGDFPFLFVQLANYRAATDEVVDDEWAHLRDAQLNTLRTVPNTGMATIIDIGDANDIHPRNKQDVGLRLASWALVHTYEQDDVVASGPIYQPGALTVNAGRATVGFDLFGGELEVRGDGPLRGFTIAGEDQVFHHASARIVNGSVEVWSEDVPNPAAVRYAWENNPTEANLVNEEGLPASPFRTDDWPGPTDGRY